MLLVTINTSICSSKLLLDGFSVMNVIVLFTSVGIIKLHLQDL